ncbi:MAG: glycosyltransferase family 9 protein [Ignavibacteria bacterium]
MINKEEVKYILITRTDRLGDVILTLPLVSEAKRIFKNAKIYFLIKNYAEELIRDYEGIDELVTEESLNGFWAKFRYFKTKKIDLVINVKPSFEQALMFFLLGVRYRIGTGYRWYSFLYNERVYEHRKVSMKHESDYNLNLLKFHFPEVKSEKKFYFEYSEIEADDLNKKISGLLNEKYVIIHPGSGGSSKDIPVNKLSELINEICSEFKNYKIVLTGIEAERSTIVELKNLIKEEASDNLIDVSGNLNLRELMVLIDKSSVFISNSTGPIHIAGALNKNIIGFYPNSAPMNEVRWKPLSTNSVILKPDKNSDDMNEISKEQFMQSVRNFLK